MTIGPAPKIKMLLMSVRFGIKTYPLAGSGSLSLSERLNLVGPSGASPVGRCLLPRVV